jgi:hypothetical protein
MSTQEQSNVYQLGAFDADRMLHDISTLRERIVQAWRERAVMLTREEQTRLAAEVATTCSLLLDLTRQSGPDQASE